MYTPFLFMVSILLFNVGCSFFEQRGSTTKIIPLQQWCSFDMKDGSDCCCVNVFWLGILYFSIQLYTQKKSEKWSFMFQILLTHSYRHTFIISRTCIFYVVIYYLKSSMSVCLCVCLFVCLDPDHN